MNQTQENGTFVFEEVAVYTAMCDLRTLLTGPLIEAPELLESLSLAADVLQGYLDNGGFNRVRPDRVCPFRITQTQRDAIQITRTPVGVKTLANRVTAVLPYDMQRVGYTNISRWLEYIGALEIREQEDGSRKRLPTALGEELGIRILERTGPEGKYQKNGYDEHAQQFITDNLESIMNYTGKAGSRESEDPAEKTEATQP